MPVRLAVAPNGRATRSQTMLPAGSVSFCGVPRWSAKTQARLAGAASEQAYDLPFAAGQSHQPLAPDCARRICRRRPPRLGPVAPHLGARDVDLAKKHAPECL